MALQDEIIKQSAQIKTDSYPMSIGELLNLYRDGELDVHPEFQRVYRWSDTQKTRLIESILLGIPIPPIFVAQRTDGVWDVVDGVQRMSTILQFIGELKDQEDNLVPALVLGKTKFLPSLDKMTWDGPDKAHRFTKSQQLYLKRARIDVKIVLKESDEKSKYELFMRLNTGGSPLEPQEVRNCLMIMAFPKMYEWITALSSEPTFREAISLSDRAIDEQYHMELATRFLMFRTLPEAELDKVGDIGDFLNDNLETLYAWKPARKTVEESAFKKTFAFIHGELGDDAFKKYDKEKGKFLGGFSISAFEVVSFGVGHNVKKDGSIPAIAGFEKKVQSIWSNAQFAKYSGSGVRASSRIPEIVPMGRQLFAP